MVVEDACKLSSEAGRVYCRRGAGVLLATTPLTAHNRTRFAHLLVAQLLE